MKEGTLMNRFIVVSSDTHAGLPGEQYRDYVDPQYREMFDLALPLQIDKIRKAEKRFLIQSINDDWRRDIQTELTGAWDHEQRIKILDTDGIAGEVIFPDGITELNTPPFGAGLGLPTEDIVPELQWAGARAHNRWLAEFCAKAPERRAGVALCPLLWDIDQALQEVRWAHENGLRAVLIPHMTNEFPAYHHTRYHPFWELCEALNMVVNFHSGAAPSKQFFGDDFPEGDGRDYPGAMGIYVSEVMWWTYRPMTFMIWGGVFEKFPKLRVAFTETGTSWAIPTFLRLLNHHFTDTEFSMKLGDFRSHLSMSPSEYFKRNIALGASCMPRADAEARDQIGVDRLMWGSDYPHPEGTWPNTVPQMMGTFSDMPESDIAAILGENAIHFYNFDRDALARIASNIGPEKAAFKPTP
jgi:predicted TIM-barrel fold metal-dependent hydrolase